MVDIALPNQWHPRPHQRPFFQYMIDGGTRACEIWHRRAGKDSASLNWACIDAHRKIGTYLHLLPTARQGRKVVWDNINPGTGTKVIDQVFPKQLCKTRNATEMKIELKCGSIWQVGGSDNYDALVGTNIRGIVFSEWALADPMAWEYMRPILVENGGWAIFIYTPRGRNHGWDTYQTARTSKDWHCSLLSIDNTFKSPKVPVITHERVQKERDDGMAEETIQQEFFCSFEGGLVGAFYTRELADAETSNRIGDYPWNPELPVSTFWDIGFRDNTAIVFAQRHQSGVPIIIDYYENRNMPMEHFIKYCSEQPYLYDAHWGPHDFDNTDWATGKTRTEMAAVLGYNFDIVPGLPVMDGIDAAKRMLRRCFIDKFKGDRLLDALHSYRRQYDEKRRIFLDRPYHDWSSHGSDAFRYMSIAWSDTPLRTWEERYHNKPKVRRALGGQMAPYIGKYGQ